MNNRVWTLAGVLSFLVLVYAWFFTEWFRPAPIEIASQVRYSMQPPRFDRVVKKRAAPGQPGESNRVVTVVRPVELIAQPAKGRIDPAPGGAANVTFGFDASYQLTRVRVEDRPVDGTPPTVLWELEGKSRPTRSLLYGRVPAGMTAVGTPTNGQRLIPGVPYRLLVEAGRRRGTNHFTTVALGPPE